ncbi:chondroitin sulfate N-acetylgalactosaminyltransferase 1-like [Macrobrachium rosenbergii]|uniref:chondroitin sulfate N-acetylgalactosaminyltransferase 1-like n=1 Tax=Macrobrachium rosenbergii TaxID=79674 RepID=UPI0034D5CF48
MFLAVPRRLRTSQCRLLLLFLSVGLLLLAALYVSTVRVDSPDSRRAGAQDEEERSFNYPEPEPNGGVTIGDEVIFRYFDGDDLSAYQTPEGSDSSPSRPLTRQEVKQLTSARAAALRHLEGEGSLPGGRRYLGGRYRWLAEGVEYDLSFGDPGRGVTTRLTLFQQLEPTPRVVRTIESSDRLVVNLVVALKGRTDKFSLFLDHLVGAVLPEDHHLTLTVVYFADAAAEEAREAARRALSSAATPGIEWSFVPLEGEAGREAEFSRGRGLDVGVEEVLKRRRRRRRKGEEEEDAKVEAAPSPAGGGDLLFFCDVDVLPKADFFRRCRANAVEGRQAYFPVLFSLYNPRLVRPLGDGDPPPTADAAAAAGADRLEVSEAAGFWREFGYGMACVFASDYRAAGVPHLAPGRGGPGAPSARQNGQHEGPASAGPGSLPPVPP